MSSHKAGNTANFKASWWWPDTDRHCVHTDLRSLHLNKEHNFHWTQFPAVGKSSCPKTFFRKRKIWG